MLQPELVARVADLLERAEVKWMLTGSVASGIYGEPRLSHDIDLVADVSVADAKRLLDAFEPSEFYRDESAVLDAVMTCQMFNMIHLVTNEKVDFWPIRESGFDEIKFARRRTLSAFGRLIAVVSPEDLVLQKLRWAADSGGSEKQLYDVLGILRVQGASLDESYINRWADKLGVADLLANVRSRAGGS